MSESADIIPAAIRRLRKDSGMTQVEFALAIGVAPTSIHRWEAGSSMPEFEMVVSLWALSIERNSATSRQFAEFLASRTEAIRPLFHAAEQPAIRDLNDAIASLPVEHRQLAFAFIQMLKQNTNAVAEKVMRVLLEPWVQKLPESQATHGHPPRKSRNDPNKRRSRG